MINLGNYGQTVARGANMPDAQPGNSGQMLGQVATQLGQMVDVEIKQRQQEQQEIDRTRMAVGMAEYQNSYNAVEVNAAEMVAAGALKPEDYATHVREQTDKIRTGMIESADERIRNQFGSALEITQLKAMPSTMAAQNTYVKQGYGVELSKGLEQLGRLGVTNLPTALTQATTMMQTIGVKAGMTPQQIAAGTQAFAEKATFDNRAFFIENADYSALQQEHSQLQNTEYLAQLAPEKRVALLNATESRIRQIESQRKAEAAAIQNTLDDEAKGLIRVMESGGAMSPQSWEKVEGLKVNPALSPDVKNVLYEATSSYEMTASLNNMTFQDQKGLVSFLEGKAKKATPDVQGPYSRQAQRSAEIYNQNLSAFKADPWGYYQSKTGEQPTQLNLNNLEAGIAARVLQRRKASAFTGAELPVFQKSEITALSKAFGTLGEAQLLDKVRAIVLADPKAADATFAEFGKEASGLGYIGAATSRGLSYGDTGQRLDKILAKGFVTQQNDTAANLYKPKGAALEQFNREFNELTAGLFINNPARAADVRNMVELAYLGLTAQQDDRNTDRINRTRIQSAINIATGGVSDFNKGKVIRPYGMTTEKFTAKSSAILKDIVNKKPILGSDFRDEAQLVNGTRENEYFIRFNGDLMYQDGKPMTYIIQN